MIHARHTFRLIIAAILIFLLHAAFSDHLAIKSAHPNLALTSLFIICLFENATTGAWIGFLIGSMEGAYVGMYLGSFIVTRTIAGWTIGILEERIFRDSPVVALLITLFGTLFVHAVFYFFAPQPHLIQWIYRVAGEMVMNTIIALPLYYIIRKLA